ncbi:D-alanyl-D-alanine carboxypeptidase family protein [Oceanispirochaeta crateris]|uniref:D-alanyl-D-alanine carboxypeptidase family protein n=1 Tax=Oceanispirochaeta crateris TaxID=2518645 RepID=A0A5C1QKH9_9SPIO|nr:M15 family metallopeptidase [Oceanispirochaeta crateris]QEN07828.1 D-alanyl-D-alanine carboxypeptidase family protein [Oceanispirochaeta crateris]
MQKILLILTLILFIFQGCSKEEPQESSEPKVAVDYLHPAYNFTKEDLPHITEDLPENIAKGIEERPEYFLQLIKAVFEKNRDLVRLVNKENGLKPDDIPSDLVHLDDYRTGLSLSRPGHRLREICMPSLLAMTEAAGQEGIELLISSSYRSYDYQDGLYSRYVERDGQEAADRYSARPGKSQHQLGTALDFGSIDDSFAETDAGKWLSENAWKYGFSLSYPLGLEDYTGYVWESWHYRYIGEKASELEREFFGGIQERMLRYLKNKSSLINAALIP